MTYRLEGYDTFSNESYPLGDITNEAGETIDGMQPDYPTRDAAIADARKRLAHLEQTQPSSSSGGQGSGGIQDRVYIVHPDGHKERVCS